jgi:thiamine biosynthesis lipoprotein ApbE
VHHLLDPTTGRPSCHTGPDDVVAATVVAGSGAWAEALAKAAALDWPAAAARLDELGAGACVVTAAGCRHTNTTWARYAPDATSTDALEVA